MGTTLRHMDRRRAAMRSCKCCGITVESLRHLLGGTRNGNNSNHHVKSLQIYLRELSAAGVAGEVVPTIQTEGEPASPDRLFIS